MQTCNDKWSSGETGSCNVCGVPYNSPNGTWGALKQSEMGGGYETFEHSGILLYCTGANGVVLTSASAMGVQTTTLSRTFMTMRRPGERTTRRRQTGGGIFEVNKLGGSAATVYGATLPLSWTFVLDSKSDIDAQGNVIVGGGGGVYQYGFNANPIYSRFLHGGTDESPWQMVVGGALPFQVVGTSGDGLESSASWLVGAGGFAGVSRQIGTGALGLGMALDLRYAAGFSAPVEIALRSSHDLTSVTRWLDDFVVQPGIAWDFAAGSEIPDSMRVNLLVGLEFGSFVAGYHASFQGAASSHGIGLTYIGKAGELARGRSAGATQVEAASQTPCPQPTPCPPPTPCPAPTNPPAPTNLPAPTNPPAPTEGAAPANVRANPYRPTDAPSSQPGSNQPAPGSAPTSQPPSSPDPRPTP